MQFSHAGSPTEESQKYLQYVAIIIIIKDTVYTFISTL